ncbi:MAG: hypothetical protein RL268_1888 [Pseudomonadota bacterium]|jgi:hypothetical protein
MFIVKQHHLFRGQDRLSQELADLARRVRHLSPCRRDPERFHADKSDIEATLRRLSQEAGTDTARPRPQGGLQGGKHGAR